jgi:hypothetical protein
MLDDRRERAVAGIGVGEDAEKILNRRNPKELHVLAIEE